MTAGLAGVGMAVPLGESRHALIMAILRLYVGCIEQPRSSAEVRRALLFCPSYKGSRCRLTEIATHAYTDGGARRACGARECLFVEWISRQCEAGDSGVSGQCVSGSPFNTREATEATGKAPHLTPQRITPIQRITLPIPRPRAVNASPLHARELAFQNHSKADRLLG